MEKVYDVPSSSKLLTLGCIEVYSTNKNKKLTPPSVKVDLGTNCFELNTNFLN